MPVWKIEAIVAVEWVWVWCKARCMSYQVRLVEEMWRVFVVDVVAGCGELVVVFDGSCEAPNE